MQMLSINLLPGEYLSEQLKRAKFSRIQFISISILLAFFFIASLTSAFSIMEKQKINLLNQKALEVEEGIKEVSKKEVSLVTLKNRLEQIMKYTSSGSKQAELFAYFKKILPAGVSLNSLSIDKTGEITTSIILSDVQMVDEIVKVFTPGEDNSKIKIKEISVDGLRRNAEGVYGVNLKLKAQ